MEEEIERYIEMVRRNPFTLEDVPEEAQKSHPEICIEAVKINFYAFRFVPEEVQKSHPEICIEAIKIDYYAFKFVPEEVQKSHPEICIEAVKQRPDALEYVSEEVQNLHPEICIEAVKKKSYALEYVPEEVKKSHPEICIEAVKIDPYALKYVPEEVQNLHPEICIEAVKQEPYTIKDVPEEVQKSHPKICIEAGKKNSYVLRHLPEEVQKSHPEIYIEVVKENTFALEDVPEKVQNLHPEICIEAIKIDYYAFRFVPEEVKKLHPEICIEAVKKRPATLEDVSEEVQIEHPEICVEAVKQAPYALAHVSEEVQIEHPEICIEAVNIDPYTLEYVPEEVQKSHPEICIEAVKKRPYTLQYVSEEVQKSHLEMCIEALDNDINSYIDIKGNNIELPEIMEYMFEDIERIKKIKEKASYINENDDDIFKKRYLDIFYHKIIKSIGIDELEKLVEVPNLTDNEVREYQLEYDEEFNKLFDRAYRLKGNVEAVIEIFRSLDLSTYEQKGKNVKFDVFKNINKQLEDTNNNITLDKLIKNAIEGAGLELDENVIKKLNGRKNNILNDLIDERLEKVSGTIERKIEEGITEERRPVRRIIESQIRKNLLRNEGILNEEELLNSLREELNRKRENGLNFYSPHITNQAEKIENVTKEILRGKEKDTLSESLVEVVRQTKESIGQGWIRKLQGVPERLSKEEYESLEKRLGIKLESEYKIGLKEGVDEKEAYRLLSKHQVPGVLTYNQIEMMFSSISKPYSEEFREYYKKHKEEILRRPDVYSQLSQIHNKFDYIITSPETVNIYRQGNLDLDTILRVMADMKFEKVKPGNERLADIAAKSGLTQKEFDEAQEVWEKTKKREESNIPQVAVEKKKYRGRMLRADDELNLYAGNITTCCQRFGDVGKGSMIHGSTEKNGGIFVVEQLDEKGKVKGIIGQSWTWRNKGRLCFDNIEITKTVKDNLNAKEQEEILGIYKEAGEQAIKTDEKVMDKLLKEGKITRRVYDEVVLKEVSCGLNMYNDLDMLEEKYKSGELKETTIVLPEEAEKEYNGTKPWIDSKDTQVLLAKMPEKKREEIETSRENAPREEEKGNDIEIEYKNVSEVVEYKGREIKPSDVEKIKKVERTVYREEQQILQESKSETDIAEIYDMDKDNVEVVMSKDEGWYMIGEEREDEYYIADLAMVGGVNSQRNENITTDMKITTFEMAEKVYEKMLEMGEKEKTVRFEATRDTSYINIQRAKEKGLVEIIEDKNDKFEDSDIDMNNMIVKPNVEKLREELEKIRKVLEKLKEKEREKVIISNKNIGGEAR